MKRKILTIALVMGCFLTSPLLPNYEGNIVQADVSDNELDEIAEMIKEAEESIISASTCQISYWNTNAQCMEFYFLEDKYQDAYSNGVDKKANEIHKYRENAIKKMDTAKEMLKDGSGEYYDAVKEYYKTVKKFLNLISEFPEGYSKLTFMNTVADYKSECQDMYSEVEFNQ